MCDELDAVGCCLATSIEKGSVLEPNYAGDLFSFKFILTVLIKSVLVEKWGTSSEAHGWIPQAFLSPNIFNVTLRHFKRL